MGAERFVNTASTKTSTEACTPRILTTGENSYLKGLTRELSQNIFGQQEACEAVAKVLVNARSGMRDFNRPAAVLLFTGPSGTGKTEMAKTLAKYLTGDSGNMTTLNMTDYQEASYATRITGSAHNYVGYGDQGAFSADRLNNGPNVVLLDEIDKAHPDVIKALMPVLEVGLLENWVAKSSEGFGRASAERIILNFRDSFIICTANIGADQIGNVLSRRKPGFVHDQASLDIDARRVSEQAVRDFFRHAPQVKGRIDQVIHFNPLKTDHYLKIFDKLVAEFNDREVWDGEKRVIVQVSSQARQMLINKSTAQREIGARGIRSCIYDAISSPLGNFLLSDCFTETNPLVTVDANPTTGELAFSSQENPNPPAHDPQKTKIGAVIYEATPPPSIPIE